MIFFCIEFDTVPTADNLDAKQEGALLFRIVINDANHLVEAVLTALQIPEDHCTAGAAADQHGRPLFFAVPADLSSGYAIDIPYECHAEEQEDDVQGRHAAGKIYLQDFANQESGGCGQHCGDGQIADFFDTGKFP